MFSIAYYTSLSDKYGRKIIMALAFFNTLLVLGSLVLMSIYWDQIGLPLMILSGLVNGLLGGTTLGVTMALAYAADCTEPSQRSLAFSWLHAVVYFGLAVGYVRTLLAKYDL
jgi:MFS family permease